MAYSICKKCERFFKQNGSFYCDKCSSELNDSRNNISNYLQENPHASVIDIVKNTGIKLKDVNIFLEQGGVVSVDFSADNKVNLRQEEIKEEEEIRFKRESVKMKNRFTPRRLKR